MTAALAHEPEPAPPPPTPAEQLLQLLQQHTPAGDYTPTDVAHKVAELVRDSHPHLYRAWADTQLADWLHTHLAGHLRRQRSRFARNTRNAALAGKLETFATNPDHNPFTIVHTIDTDNTRRTVADMTGRDHTYVAGTYHTTAKRHATLATFHRTIATRIGDRRTADILTPTQYVELYTAITGGTPA